MGPIQGLTADQVKNYIRWIGDRRLIQLGLQPIYKIDKNPLMVRYNAKSINASS